MTYDWKWAKKVVEEVVEKIIKGFSIDNKPFPSFFISFISYNSLFSRVVSDL